MNIATIRTIFQFWPLAIGWYGTRLLRKDQSGQRFAGFACGPIVVIDPKHRGDEGLLQHELHHVARFWQRLFTLRWYRSWPARYREEIEAYAIQLKYSPGAELRFARFVSSRYGFPVTYSRVLRDLHAQGEDGYGIR
jgi:hypothetical protein